MKIHLSNVGAIKEADIEVIEGMFNIKYAINGTGKSSIASFLQADLASNDDAKKRFVPFGTTDKPSISFAPDRPKTCMVFNTEYIDQFLFNQDDLLNDTIHLLKLTPAVSKAIADYDSAIADLKTAIQAPELLDLRKKAGTIVDMYRLSKSGELVASCKMAKASKTGCNTLHPATPETRVYEKNIESPDSPAWYKWWGDGERYIRSACPFCGQPLPMDFKDRKNQLRSLFEGVDSKNNVLVRTTLLGIASDLKKHNGIDGFLKTTSAPSPTEVQNVLTDIGVYTDFADRIAKADNLNPLVFGKQSPANLCNSLNDLKIDLSAVGEEDLRRACENYNQKIDALIRNGAVLSHLMLECNSKVSDALKRFKKYVNTYLCRCGIPYQFEIKQDDLDHAETVLVRSSQVISPDSLSYGERNCLCFALFVLDVCQNNPDLVILDDPISSFDSGKRFSMFYAAFNDDDFSLKNRTTVLLTHDMTPLVDFIKRQSAGVGDKAKGWKLCNVDGHLQETEITKRDIDSTINIEKSLASDTSKPLVSRLVHARKYLEISGTNGPAYDIISSLFHGENIPNKQIGTTLNPLSEAEIQEGFTVLGTLSISGDYSSLYRQLDDSQLCGDYKATKDNYEKMAIARILFDRFHKRAGKPFNHSLDMMFHIEQDSLFSCGLFAEESIPQYVVDHVDSELKAKIHALK